jgi:NAD(P)-dependent dehydrogenase (short-subunit alcohol dehydrogenase family)
MANYRWLISGCSTGIGRVMAQYLLDAGHRVAVTARNVSSIADFKSYPNALVTALDVTNEASIHACVAEVNEKWDGVDVLINNAGYGLMGALEELTTEQIRAQMETNFFGLVTLTQDVLPKMREQKRGYIVNVSSIAGLRGFNGMSLYNASKFAVNGLSEALAMELAPFGIHVSVVEPGPYRTNWAGRSLDKSSPAASTDTNSPYAELNASVNRMLDNANGKQPGNPMQIAAVLVSCATAALEPAHTPPPVHLVFGDEAIGIWNDKYARYDNETFLAKFPHTRFSL